MPQGLELLPLLVQFFSFHSALTWGGGRRVPPDGPLTPAEDTLTVANNNSLCLELDLFLTFLPFLENSIFHLVAFSRWLLIPFTLL